MNPKTGKPFDPLVEPVVAYIAISGRQEVMISTTASLRKRLRALGGGARVLVAEPGHYYLERKRHEQFAHLAAGGEWFRWAPELAEHIDNLRKDVRWVTYKTPSGVREPVLERTQARGRAPGPARLTG